MNIFFKVRECRVLCVNVKVCKNFNLKRQDRNTIIQWKHPCELGKKERLTIVIKALNI